MNSTTQEEAKAMAYLVKGYNFCMKETHKLYKVDNFILILQEFIKK